ncbi:MAG: hypothetical protein O3A22_02220 [Bacteroidetes bacterium]|jgi:hypothetical protein|nr:hypothetical protein [Bacteroidota bacterium]MDA1382693.1 hypothetical protein [Bacteroidota bacterium]
MKATSYTLIAFFASTILITGCTKHEPFVNTEFNCECGDLSLGNRELSVRLAEGFVPSDDAPNLYRYHIVADLRTENEVANHNPNHDLVLTVDLTTDGASTTANAVDVLVANEIEVPGLDVNWDISSGIVNVLITDNSHVLTFTNVQAGSSGNGGTIDAEFTIIPQ